MIDQSGAHQLAAEYLAARGLDKTWDVSGVFDVDEGHHPPPRIPGWTDEILRDVWIVYLHRLLPLTQAPASSNVLLIGKTDGAVRYSGSAFDVD